MRIYTAPAAFLLAVTAAVLGVHYGLQKPTASAPPPAVAQTVPKPHREHHPVLSRTYVVQRGDSFSIIAEKTHTSVALLEQLNPGVSTTALRVGQQIKVK